MPQDDNATRTTARERSQERVSRYDDSNSPSSTDSSVYFDSYGRMLQDPEDLSQSRYERQSSRQASQSSREREIGRSERRSDSRRRSSSDGRKRRSGQSSSRRSDRSSERSSERSRLKDRSRSSRGSRTEQASRSSRSTRRDGEEKRRSRTEQASRSDRRQSPTRDRRQQSRSDSRQAPRKDQRQPQRKGQRKKPSNSSFLDQLPSIAVPAGIAIIVIIVLLVAIFGVLSPSCSSTEPTPQATPTSSEAAATTSIVHTVAEAKVKAQEAVQAANQSGSLDTSNNKVEALVSLLGEDETAKLISQAKTNPDALWIAAHPDEYAFDGIEIQYKILKLAADEPAAIEYVREFPAKYPATEADADKSLAMSVASPVDSVPNTAIPHLYQWDRRWAYTVYSSASFGLTGCGPTSLAMIYQGLNRTVDKTPHDMAVLAEERGFMSEYNGTDGSFFTSIAGELDLNCWESYPDASNIRDELSQGHPIIANLGPGYFTTNGHFFVLAGLTDDGKVIINDPYSVERSSQTWDADFIASETIAMYVYSKA